MIPSDRFFYRGKLHKDVFINGKKHKEAKMVIDGTPEVVWRKTTFGDKQKYYDTTLKDRDRTAQTAKLYFVSYLPTQKTPSYKFIDTVYFDGTVRPIIRYQYNRFAIAADDTFYISYGWVTSTGSTVTSGSAYIHLNIYTSRDYGETWNKINCFTYEVSPEQTSGNFRTEPNYLTLSDNGFFYAGREFKTVNGELVGYDFIKYCRYNEARTGIESTSVLFGENNFPYNNGGNMTGEWVAFDFGSQVSASALIRTPTYAKGDVIPIYMIRVAQTWNAYGITVETHSTSYVPRLYNPNGYIDINAYTTFGWETGDSGASVNSNHDRSRCYGWSNEGFHICVYWTDTEYHIYDIMIPWDELHNVNHTEIVKLVDSQPAYNYIRFFSYVDEETQIEYVVYKYINYSRSSTKRWKSVKYRADDIGGTIVESYVMNDAVSVSVEGVGYKDIYLDSYTESNICYEPFYRKCIRSNRTYGVYGNSSTQETDIIGYATTGILYRSTSYIRGNKFVIEE